MKINRSVVCLVFALLLLSDVSANDRLNPGEILEGGQSLYSSSGNHRLTMQTDGNLVIYTDSNKVLWHTGTNGKSATRLSMQGDGNLVLYTAWDAPVWHTHTDKRVNQGIHAIIQNDGNFVLYTSTNNAIWDSNGHIAKRPLGVSAGMRPGGEHIGGAQGKCLAVPGAEYQNGTRLVMQTCDKAKYEQNWTYSYSSGKIQSQNNYCMDVRGPRAGNAVPVQIWKCSGVRQHQWSVSSVGRILSYDGRCLENSHGLLQVSSCNSSRMSFQNFWVTPADDRIECNGGGLISYIDLDFTGYWGTLGLIYRVAPTNRGRRESADYNFNPINPRYEYDKLYEEFSTCLGSYYGLRLNRDARLDVDYMHEQLACHAIADKGASKFPFVGYQTGDTWDIEVVKPRYSDISSSHDLCNKIPG